MLKFKYTLMLLFLPMAYIIYNFTSSENGLKALFNKKNDYKEQLALQKSLLDKISSTKKNKYLLSPDSLDLDLLSEKTSEVLGKTERNSIVINLKNL